MTNNGLVDANFTAEGLIAAGWPMTHWPAGMR
jgi:hypothetical protein